MKRKTKKLKIPKGATEIKVFSIFTDKGGTCYNLSHVYFRKKPRIVVWDGRTKIMEAIGTEL